MRPQISTIDPRNFQVRARDLGSLRLRSLRSILVLNFLLISLIIR